MPKIEATLSLASATIIFNKNASAVAAFKALFDSIPSSAQRSSCSAKRILNSSNYFFRFLASRLYVREILLRLLLRSRRFLVNCSWAVAAFWSTILNEPLKLLITRKMAVSAAFTSSLGNTTQDCTAHRLSSTILTNNLTRSVVHKVQHLLTTYISSMPSTFCSWSTRIRKYGASLF